MSKNGITIVQNFQLGVQREEFLGCQKVVEDLWHMSEHVTKTRVYLLYRE